MTVALSQINFRDIGGLKTLDGKIVRSGVLFRSEGPAGLLDAHRSELQALGIRTVCDLRSKGEREAAPHTWCGPDCRLLNMEMNTDVRAQGRDAWATMRADPSATNLHTAIKASYRAMPAALLPHMRAISLALIAGETPLVIHCTAGKDRTGVTVALLLLLLQVREDEILRDYARSEQFMNNPRLRAPIEVALTHGIGMVPPEELMQVMISVDQTQLQTAVAEVSEAWGGIPQYFTAANVSASEQDRLRAALLV